MNLNIFAAISKFDEEQRMVYGYSSTEALDIQGERVSKTAIEEALPDYLKFSNIREMHQASAVGTAEEATLDEKGLYIAAKIVDDNAWKKVTSGVYKGFSIGGKRLAKVGDTITKMRLSEISLVDRPANPEATFDVFKAEIDEEEPVEKIAARKDVNPKEGTKKYGKVKFADSKNKKYPLDTEEHIRAAWNYINKEKNAAKYDSSDLSEIKRKILAAWRTKIGGQPPAAKKDTVKMELTDMQKGMYEISQLACALAGLDMVEDSISWEAEREGDGSKIPAKLRKAIKNLGDILRDMVEEEVEEMNEANDMKNASDESSDLIKADLDNALQKIDYLTQKIEGLSESFEKMQNANEALSKSNTELMDEIKNIKSIPAASKAAITSVAKKDDIASVIDDKTEIKKMEEEKDVTSLIKMVHAGKY